MRNEKLYEIDSKISKIIYRMIKITPLQVYIFEWDLVYHSLYWALLNSKIVCDMNPNTKRDNSKRLSKPILFIIFLEPLLRWLQRGKNIYTFDTSKITISSIVDAHDLAKITNKLESLQIQLNKLDKYYKWTSME